jgi:hypothetical protein
MTDVEIIHVKDTAYCPDAATKAFERANAETWPNDLAAAKHRKAGAVAAHHWLSPATREKSAALVAVLARSSFA